eukprot:2105916-Rhodomonas_salina.4
MILRSLLYCSGLSGTERAFVPDAIAFAGTAALLPRCTADGPQARYATIPGTGVAYAATRGTDRYAYAMLGTEPAHRISAIDLRACYAMPAYGTLFLCDVVYLLRGRYYLPTPCAVLSDGMTLPGPNDGLQDRRPDEQPARRRPLYPYALATPCP